MVGQQEVIRAATARGVVSSGETSLFTLNDQRSKREIAVLNGYASGAESRRMMLVRIGNMKCRIAMWVSAGFLVAGFWALFAFATFPSTSERMQDVWTLVSLTCPIAIAGRHYPISLYEVLAANAVTYALVGLIVESLRHQLNHAK